jgi:hypothetical protein
MHSGSTSHGTRTRHRNKAVRRKVDEPPIRKISTGDRLCPSAVDDFTNLLLAIATFVPQ